MSDTITARCTTIEEGYEFMLAYAGQGLAGEGSSQIRDYLERAAEALSGLAACYSRTVEEENLQPLTRYEAFGAVLDGDARNALAALQLVLAQSTISSQLIDNLNASIHLRSLLTDLFLIDEIFKAPRAPAEPRISNLPPKLG